MENSIATRRLELAKKGYDLKPLPKEVDPALQLPRSRRFDWENEQTGFGTVRQHPVKMTKYGTIDKIDDEQLEQMYRSDWVTRKGVDAPAEDMTRNGISYQHNDDDEQEENNSKENSKKAQKLIEDFNDKLVEVYKMWFHAFEAIALARASGGSLTLFYFDDINDASELSTPLNENAVTEIKWIRVIPAWFAIPLTYYRDINHPKWGHPEHYQVIIREAAFGVTFDVHESRMIRMDGRFSTQGPKVQNRGWYDSEIQAVYTALRDYGVTTMEITSTVQSFTQDYLGLKGLAEKTMMGDDNYVLERITDTHFNMTSNKINVYDAEFETMTRQGTPIEGLEDIWDRNTEAVCGAWGIPRSRFMSSESGSLGGNAAESDTRNYFNGIKSKQEMKLRPWINDFMATVNLAEKMITELPSYTFNELHEQSDKERAETRNIQADTDSKYVDMGALSGEEVAISRWSKDKPDLDTVIVDFEARKEMKEEIPPEEVDAMREEIESMKMENAVNDEINRRSQESQEKKDSQPITLEVKPEIKVEAPVINIPEQKDNSKQIEDLKAGLEKINSKLDQDIDIED